MPTLTIVSRDGSEIEIEGTTDLTLMETIRDGGFDELQAICGGCCSCATCHVYIDAPDAELPPMTEDEDELLDGSGQRRPNSRLSCQVPITHELAGARVTIAPDY